MKQNALVESHIFNVRLFLEGLKRLKVTTTAIGILTVVASALIPIVSMVERQHTHYEEIRTTTIMPSMICIPAAIAILAAPLFFFVLFSFLHKRKESDFFHAIPYTRTCVYLSFTASALASIWAIQMVSALAAGILWTMVPYTTYAVGTYVQIILADLLGAAMLSGFMMLALSVSGTGGSCVLLFALFVSLVRVTLGIFAGMLEAIPVLLHDYWRDFSFFSPYWFYPLSALIAPFADVEFIEGSIFSPERVVYSMAVTLVLFIAAGLLYHIRKSEMAGNPAPGKRTQSLFRILFTLPLALLWTGLIITGNTDDSLGLIMFVCTLLCYFLYELITTKRASNMLKALPGLGIVFAACAVFGLCFVGVGSYIHYEKIEPQEIVSITIPERLLSGGEHGTNSTTYTVRDPDIISLISNAYDQSKGEDPYGRGRGFQITMTLENGRKLYRRIFVTNEELQALGNKYLTGEVGNEFDPIPSPNEVFMIQFSLYTQDDTLISERLFQSGEDGRELLELLKGEFESLSVKEKISVYSPTNRIRSGLILELYCAKGEIEMFSINEYLPKTQTYLWGLITAPEQSSLYIDKRQQTGLSVSDMLDVTVEKISEVKNGKDQPLPDDFSMGMEICCLSDTDQKSIITAQYTTYEQLAQALSFFKEHITTYEPMHKDDFSIDDEEAKVWYVYLSCLCPVDDSHVEATIHMTVAMTDKDREVFNAISDVS